MASTLINAWLVLCWGVLCGFTLGQDSRRTCSGIKSCYCLGRRVNCERKQLTSIPLGIPSDITALDLSHNNIKNLDVKQLSKFTSLRELYLHHNVIKSIPPWDSFPTTLSVLSLHHNKIVSIPSFNTTKVHSLRSLFLNSNKISSIGTNAFTNLTNLQVLKLQKNRLSSVPSAALTHSISLRYLDLSRNSFKTLKTSSFGGLRSLQVLRLSKNKISSVHGAYWALGKLEQLYLDRNNFSSIQTRWFFGLGSLQQLFLQNNKISQIITKYADWRSFPVLRKLNLDKNKLSHISDLTFKHLLALKALNLANNHIYHTTERSFSDLHLLEFLDLSNNDISWTVEEMSGPFSGLRNLASLRLDGNRITSIAATAFIGLESLKYLNLSANIITSVQENAFREMKKLEMMWLNTTHLLCDCKLRWLPQWLRAQPFFRTTIRARCLHPQHLQMKSIFNVTRTAFVCDTSNPVPLISGHPSSQMVLRGQNVTLRCRVQVFQKNSSVVRLKWRRNYEVIYDGVMTTPARTTDANVVTYIGDLRLIHVAYIDQGLYQCIASNQFGSKISKKAQLDVLEFPVLTSQPIDVTVQAGNDIRLPCSATGNPLPTISWRMDEGTTKFPAALDRRIEHRPLQNLFIIKNAKAEDMGSYTCSATNDAGSVNATAFVTVLEVPRFTQAMSSKTVNTGESVVLECIASGSPLPRFTWYKNGREITFSARVLTHLRGQLLVIVRVQRDDEGTYTCEVSNTLGTARQTAYLTVVTGSSARGMGDDEPSADRYDKKTFLGIIVIVVVSCVVGTSLVWLLVIYCARRGSSRRFKHDRPLQADTSDETNSKNVRDDISYMPLKSSSSGSTQTSRDSPRSTATFLASSDSQGTAFPPSTSGSENNAASDKASTADNLSSENSLKGSHCSLTSSCQSDESEPLREVVHVQIHTSDSDSDKCKTTSPARRKQTPSSSGCKQILSSPASGSVVNINMDGCGTTAVYCGSLHGLDSKCPSSNSTDNNRARGVGHYQPMTANGLVVRASTEQYATTHV